MKTPREILLTRHQAAEPKLDAVRARVVAALAPHPSQPQPFAGRWLVACQEFFRIPRGAWAGLAAVWLVILGLNVATHETVFSPPSTMRVETKRSPETLQALREQKRLFAELVGSLKEMDADVPRFVPRPRSENQPPFSFA